MSFEDLVQTSFTINLGNDEDGNSILIQGGFSFEDDTPVLNVFVTANGYSAIAEIELEGE